MNIVLMKRIASENKILEREIKKKCDVGRERNISLWLIIEYLFKKWNKHAVSFL